ncbi:MAG: single-stranded DNA-binding protein [Gammaproteobacteria bacterium]|nr:single-stranded DNA-binding protein [Gammaproteobacteria bacterium]
MAGRSLNKVQLIGNLGRDPEIRYMQSGNSMTTFSIATGKTWTDQSTNERRERTDWHNVVCWGRLAEVASQYLHKGSHVYVEGELQTRQYDREGQTHYRTEINCRELIMLGRAEANTGPSSTSYDRPAPSGGRGNYERSYSNQSSQPQQPQRGSGSDASAGDPAGDSELEDDLPF